MFSITSLDHLRAELEMPHGLHMSREAKNASFEARQTELVRFIRRTLSAATGQSSKSLLSRSGKVFYSSPKSLFGGGYILMGYNPGGDPKVKGASVIAHNVAMWSAIGGNHYWEERWDTKHDRHNPLQKRVHELFCRLEVPQDNLFASNLWFLRSREAAKLDLDETSRVACIAVWKRFLAESPARRIICIGINTAEELLPKIGAENIKRRHFQTIHPGAKARLFTATIQGQEFRLVGLPHLSRFHVAKDERLVRAIKRHFQFGSGLKTEAQASPPCDSAQVTLAAALQLGPPPAGNLAAPVFAHGTLAVELYTPVGVDPQTPHTRDEIYFVARGTGWFFNGADRRPVGTGDFLFVPAGQVHRFEEFSADFAVWVAFYGPEGGEAKG